jgi:hypothetical protein
VKLWKVSMRKALAYPSEMKEWIIRKGAYTNIKVMTKMVQLLRYISCIDLRPAHACLRRWFISIAGSCSWAMLVRWKSLTLTIREHCFLRQVKAESDEGNLSLFLSW